MSIQLFRLLITTWIDIFSITLKAIFTLKWLDAYGMCKARVQYMSTNETDAKHFNNNDNKMSDNLDCDAKNND